MKTSTPTFVLELPLRVNDQQDRFLTQAFEFGRTLYNATLGTALGQIKRLRESKEWREARNLPKGKERSQKFAALQRKRGLTENGLRTIANNHRKASGRNDIGAHEAQCIGRTVWRTVERYMFKDSGRPRFKSYRRGLNSIEGTDNHEIIFKPERQAVVWRKQELRILNLDKAYSREALSDPLNPAEYKRTKYCRILRRTLNGVRRWYVQIVLEGLAPVRMIPAPVSEVVGIDPGPSQIAYFHEHYADIVKVAPHVDLQEREIRRLQRKIDRSRRANNPDNYEDDGQIKKGPLKWHISHRMKKLTAVLAEHYRCLAATRKRDHGELVNRLLQIGGTIKIEKNSYRSYQRNFGKSTTRSGMGMFVDHLKRKAASAGAKVVELNAYELKMSQYDPQTDAYRKKPLKERWHRWGNSDILVQRDIMSAFLACYATENGHDRSLLLRKWATAEPLLSGSGLCRRQPRSDQEEPKGSLRLTKPRVTTPAERERGLPRTFCAGSDVRSDCPFGDPAGRAFCRSE